MAYGSTPKEARDKATEVRNRLRAQPTVEELPFLVLAEQRWNVAEACRLLNHAVHPTQLTTLDRPSQLSVLNSGMLLF